VRASVVNKVELDVSPSTDQLKLALTFAVRLAFAAFGYRKIGRKKRPADPLDKLEDELDPPPARQLRFIWSGPVVGQIVEE
jgi:hypothetical protein